MDEHTLAVAVCEGARVWPDRPFLIGDDRTLTYAEFDRLTDVVASRLAERGYGPGDRIAIAAPNSIEWVALWLGAMKLGVVVVALNVRYRATELRYMLAQSGARGVVAPERLDDVDFTELLATLAAELPEVCDYFYLGTPSAAALFEGEAAVPDVVPTADSPAVILYTSGTTGQPKGATLTQGSIIASAGAEAKHLEMSGDIMVGSLPFNHVGGLSCTVTAMLLTGGAVIPIPQFSPRVVLELVERHHVTVLGGVPTMWVLMIGHPTAAGRDLSSVRLAVIGGSNLEPATAQHIVELLPYAKLVNLYGLSEVSGAAALSRLSDDLDTVIRTLGVVITGFDWRVSDVGELQLRGPAVAAGYWELPEDTLATFGPDGWLHTGDVVGVEPDGHLVFRARMKEMFLQGGYNVYPVEVENVLGQHPDVVQAAGIGVPDSVLGEIGRYFVQLAAGATTTADDLTAWCADRLADYKVPRQIVFVDGFPLTPAGKIQKSQLPRG